MLPVLGHFATCRSMRTLEGEQQKLESHPPCLPCSIIEQQHLHYSADPCGEIPCVESISDVEISPHPYLLLLLL